MLTDKSRFGHKMGVYFQVLNLLIHHLLVFKVVSVSNNLKEGRHSLHQLGKWMKCTCVRTNTTRVCMRREMFIFLSYLVRQSRVCEFWSFCHSILIMSYSELPEGGICITCWAIAFYYRSLCWFKGFELFKFLHAKHSVVNLLQWFHSV